MKRVTAGEEEERRGSDEERRGRRGRDGRRIALRGMYSGRFLNPPPIHTFLLHAFITLILGFGEANACDFHNSRDSAEEEEM